MKRKDEFQKILDALDRMSAMITTDMSMQIKSVEKRLDDLDIKQKVVEDETIPSIMREWLFGAEKGDK